MRTLPRRPCHPTYPDGDLPMNAIRPLIAAFLLLPWCPGRCSAADPVPQQTESVAMRDGVRLATDIYLPSPDAKGLPCILMRTPYGRTRYNRETGSMAQWGYAVAIQDTRGRFDSQGKAMAFQSDGWGERQDGYDTVEWLARQPFCNGRVATVGASAMGITQNLMAPAAPPSLVCQYILVAPASLYHEASYAGGVLRKKQVEDYLRGQAHPDALQLTLDHPQYDAHWRAYDTIPLAGRVRVPAIHYGGWFDTFSEGTIRGFVARQNHGGEGARGRQKLVMGPWTHGGPSKTEFGDFELPEAARRVPIDISARRWFDHHLMDKPNGIDTIPPIIYYVMGPMDGSPSSGNVWRTAKRWPVPTVATPFYLAADGKLTRESAPINAGRVVYTYDPADPTPTHGGRNLTLPAGPKDQRRVESRSDVVTFTTGPLTSDLEIAGRVTARVFFSTEARDIDMAVRLCDVYPDGRSILIAEGIRRLSHRAAPVLEPVTSRVAPALEPVTSRVAPVLEPVWLCHQRSDHPATSWDFVPPVQEPVPPITEVEVDLWSTAIVFAKGHRIRVSISSANYPRWQANPNVGEKPARNTIYLGKDRPSRLVLPVPME